MAERSFVLYVLSQAARRNVRRARGRGSLGSSGKRNVMRDQIRIQAAAKLQSLSVRETNNSESEVKAEKKTLD